MSLKDISDRLNEVVAALGAGKLASMYEGPKLREIAADLTVLAAAGDAPKPRHAIAAEDIPAGHAVLISDNGQVWDNGGPSVPTADKVPPQPAAGPQPGTPMTTDIADLEIHDGPGAPKPQSIELDAGFINNGKKGDGNETVTTVGEGEFSVAPPTPPAAPAADAVSQGIQKGIQNVGPATGGPGRSPPGLSGRRK